jgi:hypothetical protein
MERQGWQVTPEAIGRPFAHVTADERGRGADQLPENVHTWPRGQSAVVEHLEGAF